MTDSMGSAASSTRSIMIRIVAGIRAKHGQIIEMTAHNSDKNRIGQIKLTIIQSTDKVIMQHEDMVRLNMPKAKAREQKQVIMPVSREMVRHIKRLVKQQHRKKRKS